MQTDYLQNFLTQTKKLKHLAFSLKNTLTTPCDLIKDFNKENMSLNISNIKNYPQELSDQYREKESSKELLTEAEPTLEMTGEKFANFDDKTVSRRNFDSKKSTTPNKNQQYCIKCQCELYMNLSPNYGQISQYGRASYYLEIESLKRIIDDLCQDNQIMHDDLTLSMNTLTKVMKTNKKLKKQVLEEKKKNEVLANFESKLKDEIEKSTILRSDYENLKNKHDSLLECLKKYMEDEIKNKINDERMIHQYVKENEILRNILNIYKINEDYVDTMCKQLLQEEKNVAENLKKSEENKDKDLKKYKDLFNFEDFATSVDYDKQSDDSVLIEINSISDMYSPKPSYEKEASVTVSEEMKGNPYEVKPNKNIMSSSTEIQQGRDLNQIEYTKTNEDKGNIMRRTSSRGDLSLEFPKNSLKKKTKIRKSDNIKFSFSDIFNMNIDDLGSIDFDFEELGLNDLKFLQAQNQDELFKKKK